MSSLAPADDWVSRITTPFLEPPAERMALFKFSLDKAASSAGCPAVSTSLITSIDNNDLIVLATTPCRVQPVPVLTVKGMLIADIALADATQSSKACVTAVSAMLRSELEKFAPPSPSSHVCDASCSGTCPFVGMPKNSCRSFAFEGWCGNNSCGFAHYAPVYLPPKMTFVAVMLRKPYGHIRRVAPLFVLCPDLRDSMCLAASRLAASSDTRAAARQRRRDAQDRSAAVTTQFASRQQSLATALRDASEMFASARALSAQNIEAPAADVFRELDLELKRSRAESDVRAATASRQQSLEIRESPLPVRPEPSAAKPVPKMPPRK